MKKLCLLTILIIPLSAYAIMCPNSFNQINYGDTIARVLSVCGPPSSQYQYVDTVSVTNGNTYTAPNYVYGFGNIYQPYGFTSVQENQTVSHQRRITKFVYYGMQPAVLLFVNGQLEERQLLHQ